jgi:hypothetical protein
MSLSGQIALLLDLSVRPAEAFADIADAAYFHAGFANPAILGYLEAAASGAGRLCLRQLT